MKDLKRFPTVVPVKQDDANLVFHATKSDRVRWIALLLVFAASGAALVHVRLPLNDEGYYADASFNLAVHGNMGSPALVAHQRLKGIERYTYWEMPLHILMEAAAFRAFGVSVLVMRYVTLVWGVLALCCWYFVLNHLFPRTMIPFTAAALLALDFTFIAAATIGRSDMMSFALGAAGLAAYVGLRARRLGLALFCGHTLVMLSGLTHPNGGLSALASLLVMSLWLDRNRFQWFHFAVSAAPYLAGAAGWSFYILQRPDYFLAQFGSSAQGRLQGLSRPWFAIGAELIRYADAFGLRSSGLLRFRAALLALYAAGLAASLTVPAMRQKAPIRILLWLTGLQFLLLTFTEAAKQGWYLLFIIVYPISLCAATAAWLWEKRGLARALAVAAGVLIFVIQTGQIGVLMERNPFRNEYLPAVRLMRDTLRPGDLLVASTELGFGVGFDHVLDDPRTGYRRHPRLIVIDQNFESAYQEMRAESPNLYAALQERLTGEYQLIYKNKAYSVYVRI